MIHNSKYLIAFLTAVRLFTEQHIKYIKNRLRLLIVNLILLLKEIVQMAASVTHDYTLNYQSVEILLQYLCCNLMAENYQTFHAENYHDLIITL
jgi:hypothetical protein